MKKNISASGRVTERPGKGSNPVAKWPTGQVTVLVTWSPGHLVTGSVAGPLGHQATRR